MSHCAPQLTFRAACWMVAAVAAVAAVAVTGLRGEDRLKSKILPLVEAHSGQVAVAIKHLTTGEGFEHRADAPMPTASLIKFPVMVAAYSQARQGRLDLQQLLTLREADKVPGSGLLTAHFSSGAQISLRDAIRLMIAYSDNTATNLVLDQIGLEATAELMEQLGLPNTKIHSKVYRGDTSIFPERSKQFGLGSTTAAETIRLYELLQQRKLIDEPSCERMLEHLRACQDANKLARRLPAGARIAHKGGAVSAARTDAGVIDSPAGPIAVCVLTSDNKDRRWSDDNQAEALCAAIARIAYDHFNSEGAAAPPAPQALRLGASGYLVESLQRTLNARLAPSPGLAIDGEFGAQTEAAVVRFQRSQQVDANGSVGPETWKALGPLITQDKPVAAPDEVNGQQLARSPPDTLSGPPLVTCAAWAVADGKTGELLWSSAADRRLDIASTTKIMTALVVLRQAEKKPPVLDEDVVFSARADGVAGSTAGIRAGERLPVRELLYGLLLPSGNDAAVALAEHFGRRFPPSSETPQETDPVARFVAEMNRTAAELEMQATSYRNPHGLTERGHLSSAGDLVRLAHAALQNPRMREYVATRQHGCQVVGAEGYRRNVVWKNTNQLLASEGFDGFKTGTTRAAGACLVSSGRRSADHLLVVVLGAASSASRYVDTRNLYRWAWRERGHTD